MRVARPCRYGRGLANGFIQPGGLVILPSIIENQEIRFMWMINFYLNNVIKFQY
jgi:hypothetical protein